MPVDAEGVIAAVLGSPFFMVDNSGRDGSHIEIGHSVGSDHHGASLLVEGFRDLTQGMLVTVYIIAIQSDGELAASHGAIFQQPPMPRSSRSGWIWIIRGSVAAIAWIRSEVPSVE